MFQVNVAAPASHSYGAPSNDFHLHFVDQNCVSLFKLIVHRMSTMHYSIFKSMTFKLGMLMQPTNCGSVSKENGKWTLYWHLAFSATSSGLECSHLKRISHITQ